jgi:hypothetical protein
MKYYPLEYRRSKGEKTPLDNGFEFRADFTFKTQRVNKLKLAPPETGSDTSQQRTSNLQQSRVSLRRK